MLQARVLAVAVGISAVVGLAILGLFVVWGGVGFDFRAFYAAAQLLSNDGNPFDVSSLRAAEEPLFLEYPLGRGTEPYNPYPYPPLFALLLTPLIALGPRGAYLVFLLGSIAAAAAAGFTLARAFGRGDAPLVALLVATAQTAQINYLLGQVDTFVLFGLAGGLWLHRTGRPWLAGAFFCLGWLKPHLAFPITGFILLSAAFPASPTPPRLLPPSAKLRESLQTGAALIGWSLALAVAQLLTLGPEPLAGWLGALFLKAGNLATNTIYYSSLGSLYTALPSPLGGVATALAVTAALGYGAWLVLTSPPEPDAHRQDLRLGAFAAGWLALFPYVHPQDDLLLAFPLVALAGRDGWGPPSLTSVVAFWLNGTVLFSLSVLPDRLPWHWVGVVPVLMTLLAAHAALRRVPERTRG